MQIQAGARGGTRRRTSTTSFGILPHFVDSGESLLSTLNSQSAAVRGLVANTGEFFNAISARRGRALGADHGRQQPVPDHRAAQPGARRRVQGAAELRASGAPGAPRALRASASRPTPSSARLTRSPPSSRRPSGSPTKLSPSASSPVRPPRPDRHRVQARAAGARQHPGHDRRRC